MTAFRRFDGVHRQGADSVDRQLHDVLLEILLGERRRAGGWFFLHRCTVFGLEKNSVGSTVRVAAISPVRMSLGALLGAVNAGKNDPAQSVPAKQRCGPAAGVLGLEKPQGYNSFIAVLNLTALGSPFLSG